MSPAAGAKARFVRNAGRVALLAAVALEPFVAFAATNRSQLAQTGRLLLYAVVAVALALGCFALTRRAWRRSDADALALAVAMCVWSFFHFSVLFSSDPSSGAALVGSLLAWLILTMAAARVVFLVGGNATVRFAATTFAVSAVLLQAVAFVGAPQRVRPDVPVAARPTAAAAEDQPNVYWMVLDSHARPDVMRDVSGYDLTPFVSALEQDGFEVSRTSRTSYPRTVLSLASTLEMRYVLEPGQGIEDDYAIFGPSVVGDNETVRRLRSRGYRTLYGEAGGLEWSACREETVDACLPLRRPWPATGELERSFLDVTPLGMIDLPIPYSDPQTLVEGTRDLVGGGDPFFAFVHILAPHFPYRYRDDCTARGAPLGRGADTPEERVASYRTQVRCVDALVERAVDSIVARDPSAIVVIQSDHGSDVGFTWSELPEDWGPGQVTERFGVFNAMRLPEECNGPVEGAALVNTFRIVLACIEGREPDLLEYRAFGQPLNEVGELSELTPEQIVG